jgi:outer membrane biosynthesis protein TonB
MKLTKGKLSKLFHKKKQTMRRYKNQRKYRRASKTFRQRKPLNLHRSSMKKIGRVGGAEPDEKVPLVVKPASDEATTTTEMVSEPITEPVPEPVSEPAVEPVPESTAAEEPLPEPVAEEPSTAPVVEPEPMPVSEPEPVPMPEPEPEPVAEEPLAKSVEEPIVAENVNPEPASTTPSVADALNLIADKIASAVIMKMRENPANGSSPNQDADIAVPLAINAVVRQTQLAPEK